MNIIYWWLLRKIATKCVIQGDHKYNIGQYYNIIREAAQLEFKEELESTTNMMLIERYRAFREAK
jgi:hypothetical protein